jgi:hypothetical protein
MEWNRTVKIDTYLLIVVKGRAYRIEICHMHKTNKLYNVMKIISKVRISLKLIQYLRVYNVEFQEEYDNN